MTDLNKTDRTVSSTPKNQNETAHKVGDAVERVGEKMKDMGADKLGGAVYNAGNKLEHPENKKKI